MVWHGSHTAHNYALARLPFVKNYDYQIEPWKKGYALHQRQFPEKARYVSHFDPKKYDVAILHLDQQCLYRPSTGDRIGKGRIYQEMRETIGDSIPVITIMHQTPYHDKYTTAEVIEYFKEQTKDDLVVLTNSHECKGQWGFKNGHTIVHGLDVDEWGYDVNHFNKTGERRGPPKEPRCVLVQSPAGMENAYRRTFIHETIRKLQDSKVPIIWIGVDKEFDSFDDYRDYLARSLVFFQGAWQSPMPRSRTEGMLSGCCTVTTPYHDAKTFIKSGWLKQEAENGIIQKEWLVDHKEANGFLTSAKVIKDPRVMDSPEYAASLIKYLIFKRPDIALKVGGRGKQMAREKFSKEVFDKQWEDLLIDKNILDRNWDKT